MGGRKLGKYFNWDLKRGFLKPLRERVLLDTTLCMEIRENGLNIYYRGGNLMELTEKKAHVYGAGFHRNYAGGDFGAALIGLPTVISSAGEVSLWLAAFPKLKLAMDLYFGRHPSEERDIQQQLVRENNFGYVRKSAQTSVARSTDYFICDIEYAVKFPCPIDGNEKKCRFDFVGVHWPASGTERKVTDERRLVVGEIKYGVKALGGSSGLADHAADVAAFFEDSKRTVALMDEMTELFNQKLELGLIDCEKPLGSFSVKKTKPVLLLVFANHNPRSAILKQELIDLQDKVLNYQHEPEYKIYENVDILIANGCFTGYGLYDPAIHPLVGRPPVFDGYVHTP